MSKVSTFRDASQNSSQRVAEELRHALAEGRPYPHGQLPSHRELCRQHRVGVNTLRKALDILEQEGVLYRVERGGTFLSTTLPRPAISATGASLKCINFLEQYPPLWTWLKTDYLAGYTDALDHVDIKMRFVPCPRTVTNFTSLILDRLDLKEQGCVLVNVAPPRLLEWLRGQNIPFVVQYFTAYERTDLPEHHSVYVNKTGAAADAVRHLLELGHRRIGYAGPLHPGQGVVGLYEGYRAALQCAGLGQTRVSIVAEVNTDDVSAAMGQATEYLRQPNCPTAIFAGTDAVGIALLRAAQSLGIAVPRQLSVVGFNDQPEAAASVPPLTTMAGPRRLLARTAVETLLSAAEGKFDSFQTKILNCRLVMRQSTAAPEKT